MPGTQSISILGASVALLLSNGAQALPNCASGSLASNGICNTSLSPNARAAALVAAMQDSEKLANLVSKSPGVSRLGLPAYNWWSEALHGIAAAPGTQFTSPTTYATSFPEPVLMAAAFDDDLIYQVGTVIGIEGRAFGNNAHSALDFWSPNVNAFRDPRWGRGGETPGEDILRIKRYADSYIRGMEGNQTDVERRVIATCKHYAGYDLEQNRYAFNAQITPQDLAEYYMPPFQQCARDSKVGSIMCSYNAVNGIPA
jgi:xylan 1,4-beta-xylosidase